MNNAPINYKVIIVLLSVITISTITFMSFITYQSIQNSMIGNMNTDLTKSAIIYLKDNSKNNSAVLISTNNILAGFQNESKDSIKDQVNVTQNTKHNGIMLDNIYHILQTMNTNLVKLAPKH